MLKTILRAVGLFFICFSAVSMASASASPEQILQKVSNEMIAELKAHSGHWQAHMSDLEAIIARVVVPHMAVDRMARSVVGREYWIKANTQERQAFASAFQQMIVRTYSTAFADYDGEVVKIYRSRDDAQTGRVAVRTAIVRKKAENIMVTYHFVLVDGTWLVDDFDVEGIRLVQNYRAQYADPLHQGGLNHLTALVVSHNRQVRS